MHTYFTYLGAFSPVVTETIPIFSSLKETWANNLYPSIYKVIMR